MADITRRSFLAAAGIFGASVAVPIAHAAPKKPRRPLGDWNPTALWLSTDPWGAH